MFKHIFSFYELIDLLSLIPYFYEFLNNDTNMDILKFLRMCRFFKITRFIKFFEGGDLLDRTM